MLLWCTQCSPSLHVCAWLAPLCYCNNAHYSAKLWYLAHQNCKGAMFTFTHQKWEECLHFLGRIRDREATLTQNVVWIYLVGIYLYYIIVPVYWLAHFWSHIHVYIVVHSVHVDVCAFVRIDSSFHFLYITRIPIFKREGWICIASIYIHVFQWI